MSGTALLNEALKSWHGDQDSKLSQLFKILIKILMTPSSYSTQRLLYYFVQI